ncbi:MAG: 30S ribosome-binding factor RbfA [Bacteroidales bacterium]|jgi:ribosome-binding factor A|nr:30S ribosome-binding factor RbfA [Bacteroidales bacterium]
MEESTRQNKISRLLHREMADIILKINKAKYSGKLITVSTVRVTKDLGIARIYFSIFPSEFASEVLSDIKLNSKQIRGELGRKIGKNLRIVPELEFYIDDSLDYIDNINKLISKTTDN